MKKVIVNGRFLLRRVTGVERYAREIIMELDKLIEPDEIEIAVPPEVKDIPNYINIKVVQVGRLHNILWEQISLPLYVARKKAISLNLCNASPLISPGIVVIHDMKIKAAPQYFKKKFIAWYKLLFNNVAKRAEKIITVSEFSKREIEKYYLLEPEQIVVIPNAWQHYERVGFDENALIKYGVKKDKFYFSMSSLEPNKNFRWIAEIAKRNPEYIFAVSGAINKMVFADELGFESPKNMKFLGYVSDEEAKTLMRDCKAFLFPTFYEGFGLPPLEAMSAGAKQIVVSDTEVMHEIFGDSVIYIDPDEYDVKLSSLSMKNLNLNAILEKYSWEKSSKLMRELIRR
ncbi:MAG: glycosyltransferase family 4 protein [Lachnospiraceae bacterium]|nr:glycosyltransferase family 4 protein [Lachnospiraceae bacterium]